MVRLVTDKQTINSSKSDDIDEHLHVQNYKTDLWFLGYFKNIKSLKKIFFSSDFLLWVIGILKIIIRIIMENNISLLTIRFVLFFFRVIIIPFFSSVNSRIKFKYNSMDWTVFTKTWTESQSNWSIWWISLYWSCRYRITLHTSCIALSR